MPATTPVILIVGPTAGGKTKLAIELARRLPGGGECICADSMQVYRGMDIGTAKPTPEERALAPHHLLDVADPADASFTVDRWLRLVEKAITEIRARGKWPIIVGGTNFYVKAFLHGLFEGPGADAARRARLEGMPRDALRRMLEEIDPTAAERIHSNDRRRTIRAIEVYEQTGRPISSLQQQWLGREVRADCLIIGLECDPTTINRRINARVKDMMQRGLLDEVRLLKDSGRLGPQAREALGYKQLLEHLEGRWTLQEAVEQIKIRTRRYAKQQRTWLRRFRPLPRSRWFTIVEDAAPPLQKSLEWILEQSMEDRDPGLTPRAPSVQ